MYFLNVYLLRYYSVSVLENCRFYILSPTSSKYKSHLYM